MKSPKEGILKFISTDMLSLEECDKFISLDNDINKAIKYYQFKDKDVYNRENNYPKSLKY